LVDQPETMTVLFLLATSPPGMARPEPWGPTMARTFSPSISLRAAFTADSALASLST